MKHKNWRTTVFVVWPLIVAAVPRMIESYVFPSYPRPSMKWTRTGLFSSSSMPKLPDPKALSVKEIKNELKERGVYCADCFDRESLVARLMEARETTDSTDDAYVAPEPRPPEGKSNNDKPPRDTTTESSSSTTTAKMSNEEKAVLLKELRCMPVRDLRQELAQRNLRWAGFLEKEDLVQAVFQARMQAASQFSVTGLITPGQVAELTGEQLDQELAGGAPGSFLLLDAYAVWCGPCQMMAPQLQAATQQVLGPMRGIRVAKLDTDKYPKQASALRVQGLPTLILFQNGRGEIARIEGALMKDQLVQWVESKLNSSV